MSDEEGGRNRYDEPLFDDDDTVEETEDPSLEAYERQANLEEQWLEEIIGHWQDNIQLEDIPEDEVVVEVVAEPVVHGHRNNGGVHVCSRGCLEDNKRVIIEICMDIMNNVVSLDGADKTYLIQLVTELAGVIGCME